MYRVFYTRPGIVWGLVRLMATERQFARRLAANSVVYVKSRFAAGRYLFGEVAAPLPRGASGGERVDDRERTATRPEAVAHAS
jgi:hypothetical protein